MQTHVFDRLSVDYASYLLSKGTLAVDALLYKCTHFLQINEVDPIIFEIMPSVEAKMIGALYTGEKAQPEQSRNLLFDEVFPLMEAIAPRGHFFGIHPSDPGRLGFWSNNLRFQFHRSEWRN